MKNFILATLICLSICVNSYADDLMGRYRKLPSCILAESLDSIEELERKGWTVNGNPTIAETPYGKAINFDGTGDVLTNNSSYSEYQFGTTTDFTILAWIKTSTQNDVNRIVVREGTDPRWYMRVESSGRILCLADDGTDVVLAYSAAGSNIADNNWHLVGCVFDRDSNMKVYVDGSISGSPASMTSIDSLDNSNSLQIGGFLTNMFTGQIKDTMIFNRVLSAQEISDIYYGTTFDYDKDLVLLSDLSEINPQDLWGSNSGTGTGLVASTDIVRENGDWAIETNGTDEKVDFGDIGTIRTIELWVNPATTTEELILIDTGKDIMVSGGTVTYTGVTATNTFVDGVDTDTMVANKLQHLVCVLSADVDANNFELANDGTNFGAGKFHKVAVYNTALGNIEAENLYVTEGR